MTAHVSVENSVGPVVYHIDSDDRIIYVNRNWETFAQANIGIELAPNNVIGRSLWDFIHDGETCHFHQMLIGRAKSLGKPIRVPFRCDGPDVRRFMEMELRPGALNTLEYTCVIQRSERRSPIEILSSALPRSDHTVRVCSWCKCVDVGKDRWVEIEQGIEQLGLFDLPQPPVISHTLCSRCFARIEHD